MTLSYTEFLREEKRKDINKSEDAIYQKYYDLQCEIDTVCSMSKSSKKHRELKVHSQEDTRTTAEKRASYYIENADVIKKRVHDYYMLNKEPIKRRHRGYTVRKNSNNVVKNGKS